MKIKVKNEQEGQFVQDFYNDIQEDRDYLNSFMFGENDVSIEVADGCIVEHDGICPHGYTSPLIILGLI